MTHPFILEEEHKALAADEILIEARFDDLPAVFFDFFEISHESGSKLESTHLQPIQQRQQ